MSDRERAVEAILSVSPIDDWDGAEIPVDIRREGAGVIVDALYEAGLVVVDAGRIARFLQAMEKVEGCHDCLSAFPWEPGDLDPVEGVK